MFKQTNEPLSERLLKEALSDMGMYRHYTSLNENDKEKFHFSFISKIFDSIKKKKDIMDSRKLDESKGDFEKLDSFEHIHEAIKYIESTYNRNRDIMNQLEYDTIIERLTVIKSSISYLSKYKRQFVEGYHLNKDSVIYMYRSVCIAIIVSVNFILAYSMDYERQTDNTFIVVFKKRHAYNQSNVNTTITLIDQLKIFNKLCESGKMDTTLKKLLEENMKMAGEGDNMVLQEMPILMTLSGIVLGAIAVFIILKRIVYVFFMLKQQMSSYLLNLADFVELNTHGLKNRNMNMDPKKKREIIAKQEKQVQRLRNMAEYLAVNDETAVKEAEKDVQQDIKEISQGDQNIADQLNNPGNNINTIDNNNDHLANGSIF